MKEKAIQGLFIAGALVLAYYVWYKLQKKLDQKEAEKMAAAQPLPTTNV